MFMTSRSVNNQFRENQRLYPNLSNEKKLKDVHMQWSGRFLGITGWDPSVCKSNRLHVDILQFSFIKLGYIL